MLKNKGTAKREILIQGTCVTLERTLLSPVDEQSAERLEQITGARGVFPLDEHLGIDRIPLLLMKPSGQGHMKKLLSSSMRETVTTSHPRR